MTPLEIKIMLHYHYSPYDWDGPELPDFREQIINQFISVGLLQRTNVTAQSNSLTRNPLYSITAKGQAYVDMLQEVPIPVVTYSDPRTMGPE